MMSRRGTVHAVLLVVGTVVTVRADGPKDNLPDSVRSIPPAGIEISDIEREALERDLGRLEASIKDLSRRRDARTVALLPDVQIFARAVHDALEHHEFFDRPDAAKAKELLVAGQRRAEQLLEGKAPWALKAGLIVRGYVSRIDGSVQPYGLEVPGPMSGVSPPLPETEIAAAPGPFRLDVWFHGRNEKLSEVNFVHERRRQPGQFSPPDTIVLHPYGRFCNAFKFAGEVDVLEAIEAVRRNYRIDDDRISVRGFSMGGAACWQFAVHYPDRWFAANPGAGFAETRRFLETFQKETLNPTWYEKSLWHLYDCTDVAANLLGCPTVAYSGELDNQKQAADVMAEALRAEGVELTHIIGPKTKHAYHPDSRREVARRMESLAARGRQRAPAEVTLVTYTLKYNRMHWLTIDALGEHWKRARVHAAVKGSGLAVETENVRELTVEFPSGWAPLPLTSQVEVTIDGTKVQASRPESDGSFTCRLVRGDDKAWSLSKPDDDGLHKRHDLQGPIDDAFMDSFVFVRPTKPGASSKVDAWVREESTRAVEQWRKQFRGDARVKDDTAVTPADILNSNLVLWGDPESNVLIKRIAGKLPIAWNHDHIKVGGRQFDSTKHGLVLIYPNPLNPKRYVVLNSGFTYREYDYLNNARQVPKLPDWAVIDVDTPPDARHPGGVTLADFFGEHWELRAPRAGN